MCTPALIIAGVSAAATVGGAIMTASNQSKLANAQWQAAQTTQQVQNQAFMQRMQAQSDQQQRDFDTQQQAIQARASGEADLEAQQNQAWADREATIKAANDQAAQIQGKATQALGAATSQLSPDQMAAIQSNQQKQIQQLAEPGAQNIASGTQVTLSGPVAAPTTTDSQTASAIATRLAQAAQATRDYTAARGKVASYAAPFAQVGQTVADLGNTSAPLAAEEKAIGAGLPTYLARSTIASDTAKNYYQRLLDVIQARTQGKLNVSQAIASGDISNADLAQADYSNAASNKVAALQTQLAGDPTAAILSGVGQVGAYGAGYLGAGASGTSSILSGIREWANKPIFS